jgi:hypothetical protein
MARGKSILMATRGGFLPRCYRHGTPFSAAVAFIEEVVP